MKTLNKILLIFISISLAFAFFFLDINFISNKNASKNDFENPTNYRRDIDESDSTNIEEGIKNTNKKDEYFTDPIPEGKPNPVEPQDVKLGNKKFTATLSITCETLLDNLDTMNQEKVELVPLNGIIYSNKKIYFTEGESVFDVLKRETRENKIHLEYSFTPMYNSVYIEGINNLYEFDGGNLSGWMYKVNGWFPNYGASRYQLKDGDVIEWVYTCDLGRDVGGYFPESE